MIAKKIEIVRIEEGGTVVIVVTDENGKAHLKHVIWDILCGCELVVNGEMSEAVLEALERLNTPLPEPPKLS